METTTSADGTTIAFDVVGSGPPLVLLAGATCTRGVTAPLAEWLSSDFAVHNVDRRGRGDSDDRADAPPYETEREIEDVAAVIEAAGGSAALYGHSSGAGLAARVAAADLGVSRLVLHDAPYNLPGGEQRSLSWHEQLHAFLALDRRSEAVEAFMGMVGVPEQAVAGMKQAPFWAGMEAVAPTLAYDSAAMGDRDGGLVPANLLAGIEAPTLVLVGGADHGFMIDVAHAMVEALPHGELSHLVGAGHDAGPELVGPPVRDFLLR